MTIHSSNEAPFSLPGEPPRLLRSGPPGDFFPDRLVPRDKSAPHHEPDRKRPGRKTSHKEWHKPVSEK